MKINQKIIILILFAIQLLVHVVFWQSQVPLYLHILFFIWGLLTVNVLFFLSKIRFLLDLNWRLFYYGIYIVCLISSYMHLVNI